MIEVQIVNLDTLTARLESMPEGMTARIVDAMGAIVNVIADRARSRMSDLFRNPGAMQASVATAVEATGDAVTGIIGAYGLVYARAQEFGGTWIIPELFPVNASALAFMFPGGFVPFKPGASSGGMIFAMHTQAHPVTLPERSYMRSALHLEKANAIAMLDAAVTTA
jgi:hypothetical protein